MSSELEEVRQLGANAKENNFQCSSVKKGDPTFAELQKRIKPYQGVMKYLGSNESCTACKKELLLRVRSVEPPTYFPALPPKPEKKAVKVKGKSSPTTTPKEKTGAASAN